MAASRLEKYGTIFSRTQGLLRTGAMRPVNKPMWLDIYQRYPPHVEPNALRPVPDKTLIPIFYEEDEIRAKFYSKFGCPGTIDMTTGHRDYKSLSQKFIDKYIELNKSRTMSEEGFTETERVLKSEGILFKREDRVKKETTATRRTITVADDENGFDKSFSDEEPLMDDSTETEDVISEKPLKFDLKKIVRDE